MTGAPHIETFTGHGRKPWRYRIVGSNGEPVASSQGYTRKWSRERAVKNLKKQLGLPIKAAKE